jgi:CheY-like chemotaxis protein
MNREHCVLVVEDNGDDVLFIRRALKKTGITCPLRVVGDGETALDYFEGRGAYVDRDANPIPTLLLLDLKLPRRSGFEVLQAVRANPVLGRLVVVVLTSSRESADIEKAYALGANSYLVKPISPDAMSELVQALSLYWLVRNEPAPRRAAP